MANLSDQGAREFHRLYMVSWAGFTVIAVIAHVLVWNWKPWFG
jgi:light-harvesting complex 1 beta chain